MSCEHKSTYQLPEPWPTGESIEVCNCCGMSRAHWEQGESPWTDVDLKETAMEKFLKAASDDHRNKVRALTRHGELAAQVRKMLRDHWTYETLPEPGRRSWTVSWSNQMARITANCYLAAEDSLKESIVPLLEAVMFDADMDLAAEWHSIDQGFKVWTFNLPGRYWRDIHGVDRPVGLMLYFYFGNSTKCSLQGTGKYEEIEEIVCK